VSFFAPHRRLIALIGVIVPRRLRSDWRQEWEAELRNRELLLEDWDRLNWRNKIDLFRRSTSAFWDALALQPRRLEDEMFQDLRFALRMLLKKPGFTIAAVLALGLGIGATSAIFSVVSAVMSRPLPYPQSDKLVMLWERRIREGDNTASVSPADFRDWRSRNQVFSHMAALVDTSVDVTNGSEPERVRAGIVSAPFFDVLGIQPALGRKFLPEEEAAGRNHVVILNQDLWKRRFGSDRNIVGKRVSLSGVSYEDALTAEIALPSKRYAEPKQASQFFDQLIAELKALPGVKAAGMTSLPLSGDWSRTSIAIEGHEDMTSLLPQARPRIHSRTVTSDYLAAIGVPLLMGRMFTLKDNADSPLVALVNQAAVERYWLGKNPVGDRVQIGGGTPWREVVGVVGDVKHQGLNKEITPEAYRVWAQDPERDGKLVIRGSNIANVAAALRSQVQKLDKELPVSSIELLDTVVQRSIAASRAYTLLLTLFAAIALSLAVIGIYGVMAYNVTQRTHEIGVRIALGAQSRNVLAMVVKHGMALTLPAVAIGVGGAWIITRFLKTILFEVTPTDPLTIVSVVVFLLAVVLLACYLPARKATKVDPLVALRYE